ncbi:MAG: TlpA family protein disulfide reductase [Thermoanaerobaculia bacterium]
MKRIRAAAAALLLIASTDLPAADLVRMVRYKLSAGDLASGEAAVEEYRRTTGVDPEYLDAIGWLARGAQMLGRREKAAGYAAEVRKAIPAEDPALLVPLGAAIEVEGKLRLAADGRGSALRYWEAELLGAKDPSLRSRIRKNMNLVSLEGERAPEIGGAGPRLASFSGRPVLLFFWAAGCGDCKAESAKLARLHAQYASKGLGIVAPTRLYGGGPDHKDATPEQESAQIEKFWVETYSGLSDVPRPVDTETMVRYGVSATPTYALVDRKGIVRLYAPTRLAEADLSRRIESLLAESGPAKNP